MPPILKNLFLSKKFLVALLTCAGSVAAYLGWNVDVSKILALASPFLLYIGAQGWADAGKEKARIEQETTLKAQQMAQDYDVSMRRAGLSPMFMSSSAAAAAQDSTKPSSKPGFARAGAMILIAVLGVVAGIATVVSCSHPGQVVLHAGQCVLDNGVLGKVLAALEQSNYVKAVEELALEEAPTLVECALQAVASQQASAPGPGSGSAELPKGVMPASTLVQRAREVLAARRAKGN